MTQKKLPPKQARAIEGLLTRPTVEEAAEIAGVTRRTIYRWLDEPDFKNHLAKVEGQAIDRAARRLVLLADKALDGLESVLDDPGQNGAGIKRLAAASILDNLQKLRELRNVEQRLADLEEAVHGNTRKAT